MFRPSACFIYTASTVLLVLGAAVLAAPLALRCSYATSYCQAWGDLTVASSAFHGLYAVGGSLVVVALLGCCLASTGKRRFKLPFAVLLLALVLTVAGVAVWQAGQASPAKSALLAKGDQAAAGLQTSLTRDFYHDFASAYAAARCGGDAAELECPSCALLQSALHNCVDAWVPSNASQTLLSQCTAQLTGYEQQCGGTCTRVFCQCAGTLQEELEANETYVLYGFGGVLAVLLLLLLATCCVQRKELRREEAGLRDPMLPVAPGALRLA